MKKTLILLSLTLLVFACSRKTVVTSEKEQTTSIAPTTNEDAIAQGKAVYTYRCGRCHNLKPVAKYTAPEWENILKVMIQKARLNGADSMHISAYVMANAKRG